MNQDSLPKSKLFYNLTNFENDTSSESFKESSSEDININTPEYNDNTRVLGRVTIDSRMSGVKLNIPDSTKDNPIQRVKKSLRTLLLNFFQ